MMKDLFAGIIGIGLLAAFLGIMLIWVPAPPLIAIVVLCVALMLYDFVQTLRHGEDGMGR